MSIQIIPKNTYKVEPCYYCDGIINKDPTRIFKIVEKNGEPLPEVALALIKLQAGRVGRPYANAYYARKAFEVLDGLLGVEDIADVKANDLQMLAFYLKRELSISNDVLTEYAKVMNHIFNQLVMSGHKLHDSLFIGNQMLALAGYRKEKSTNYTLAGDIILLALDKREKRENYAKKYEMPSYDNKHLERRVIDLVMTELSPLYKCIFAVSLDTGYRSSSTLSILLRDVDFHTGYVKPFHSKNGIRPELPVRPETLRLINSYIVNNRAPVIAKTGSASPYLFLTERGKRIGEAVTYDAYSSALKRAQTRVKKKHPEFEAVNFATHAARATRFNELDELRRSGAMVGNAPISDGDIKTLMGWSSLSNVPNYEKRGQPAEMSLLISEAQERRYNEVKQNED